MARTTSTNFTGGLDFTVATTAADIFLKEDVQVLAQAVDQHDHTSGKGLVLPAGAIPSGLITSAMIADGTIVAADIADGAITSAKILDGTIQTGDLADGAVTQAKLSVPNNLSAGVAWTPSITQGGSTPGVSITLATYIQSGKMVLVSMTIGVTSAGAAANDIIISTLPVAPRSAGGYMTIGNFVYVRSAVGLYAGSVVATSSALAKMIAGGSDGTTNLAGFLGNTNGPSFAVGIGDTISFSLHYEAA